MAGVRPPHPEEEFQGYATFAGEEPGRRRVRRIARYGVPVAVAGLAAATVGIGSALATTGGAPALPHTTARQLLARMAAARVDTVSGTVRVSSDLGLPAGLTGGSLGAAAGAALGPGASGAASASASSASSADPRTALSGLLTGTHTLRIAADGPDRQRVSVLADTSEYTLVRNGTALWAYDSAADSVYRATEPAAPAAARPAEPAVTPQQAAAQLLKAAGPTTSVAVDGTAEVAGQAVYELRITPKGSGSTVGAIRVAVDAADGVPLAVTVTPAAGGKPVVDVAWTSVDFRTPAASRFRFTVPKGAQVTWAKPDKAARTGASPAGLPAGAHVTGQGWNAIASFRAPATGGERTALKALGKPTSGSFGSGTLVSTRLVNALITSDGTVYAGAVTPGALVQAADHAAR